MVIIRHTPREPVGLYLDDGLAELGAAAPSARLEHLAAHLSGPTVTRRRRAQVSLPPGPFAEHPRRR